MGETDGRRGGYIYTKYKNCERARGRRYPNILASKKGLKELRYGCEKIEKKVQIDEPIQLTQKEKKIVVIESRHHHSFKNSHLLL